ncbi:MAG: 50S ribosomal protein L21 [Alphaproteobacteria bacterium]|nr:50S ribosomal protein L21 [Alphaproteobacteria bacterium]
MYAIMRSGGKQYRVSTDDVITVERLPGAPGSLVEFGEVLMIGDGKAATLGTPLLEGAVVTATILEQTRADKVLVFKKKRRQNYRRLRGHRQAGTVLRIDEVLMPGASRKPRKTVETPKPAVAKAEQKAPAKPVAEKKAPEKKAEAKPAPKAAAKKPAAKKKAAPQKTTAKKPAAKKKATPKKKATAKKK